MEKTSSDRAKLVTYSVFQRMKIFWHVYIRGVRAPNGLDAEYNMEKHRFETDPDKHGIIMVKYSINGNWKEIQGKVPRTLRDTFQVFRKDVDQIYGSLKKNIKRSNFKIIPPDGQPAQTIEKEHGDWGFPVHVSRVYGNGKWRKYEDYQGHYGIKRRDVFYWDIDKAKWVENANK